MPLARLSRETFFYKYISDFTAYSWDDGRTNTQLRAWARLLHLNKGFHMQGREIPFKCGEALESNSVFLGEFMEDREAVKKIDWHPDDYAYAAGDHAHAKEVESFPYVIEFLRSHHLPTDEQRA